MTALRASLLLVLPLLGALPAARAQTPAPVPAEAVERLAGLEFRDQYGNTDSLARWRGSPVVTVVVTAKRLGMIEQWEKDLTGRVPGIRFLNVADLPPGVPVDLERTATTLRKRVPPGVNVLLDPEREWAATFALDTALPNLLLFDGAGRLQAQFRGRWTADLASQVAAAMPREAAVP
jgi:hypothetical protein